MDTIILKIENLLRNFIEVNEDKDVKINLTWKNILILVLFLGVIFLLGYIVGIGIGNALNNIRGV